MLTNKIGQQLIYDAVSQVNGEPTWTQMQWVGELPNFVAMVRIAGLCRSDLKEAFGQREVRTDFGHEIVLEVVAEEAGAGLSIGQRVIFDPHVALRRSTGFAPIFYAHGDAATLKRAFLSVPQGMPDSVAIFAEPLACAVHSGQKALAHYSTTTGGRPPRNVALTSAGFASVLQACVFRQSGLDCDIHNRTPARPAYIRARTQLDLHGINFPLEVPEDSYDIVVVSDAFSDEASIKRALYMVRPGGLILLFGGTKVGETSPLLGVRKDALRRSEGLLQVCVEGKAISVGGTHGALRPDFDRALSLLDAPGLRPLFASLVDRTVSVTDLPGLMHRLHSGQEHNFLKTLVETKSIENSGLAAAALPGGNKDLYR